MKTILISIILLLFILKSNGQTGSVNSQLKKSETIKEFSLLVRVPLTYTTEQAKTINSKWNALLDKWKTDSTYIISFAFPGESYVVSSFEKQ